MVTKKFPFVISILFVFYISSCESSSDYERYLADLSKEIDVNTLNTFRELKLVKFGEEIPNSISQQVNYSISSLPSKGNISKYLDSICGKSSSSITRKVDFVSLSLHLMLNDELLNTDAIISEFRIYADKKRELQYLEEDKKSNEITKANDKRYSVGDTIFVVLRIDDDFVKKRITYNRWVSDSVYFSRKFHEKSVKLLCLIKDKFLDTRPNGTIDSNALVFACRLLKSSDYDVYQSEVKLEKGSEINIYVDSYGRMLGKADEYDSWIMN